MIQFLRTRGYFKFRTLPDGSQEWRKGERTIIVAFHRNGKEYLV